MPNIQVIPVRAFQDNYVWLLRAGDAAVVVDPGEAQPVLAYLRASNLRLTGILNTHHHADHVGGNAELLDAYRVPVYGPYDDRIDTVSQRLREGDQCEIPSLGVTFSILEIPAHTRTHIAFYGAQMVFCGDTLFACGCGRLFEGTPQDMHTALSKLARLPDDTLVYCGHEYTLANIRFAKVVEPSNPQLDAWERDARNLIAEGKPTLPSTIAQEKAANPFLRCDRASVIESASNHAGHRLSDAVSVLGVIRAWKDKF